jgi:uncharacterized protein
MFDSILNEQNPHWSGERYAYTIRRDSFAKIVSYLQTPHIIALIGSRRAGKSVLLRQLISHLIEHENIPPQNILFLNLEQPYFSPYRQDVMFLEKLYEAYLTLASPKGKTYIFLDEVQFFDQWPLFLKAEYEKKENKFIITGSNSSLLSTDLMTLLSGRTLPVDIFPLSFKEFIQAHDIDTQDSISLLNHKIQLTQLFYNYLQWGGYPEIISLPTDSLKQDVLSAYARSILYQDVAPRLLSRKPESLEKLYVYLISNISNLFSYKQLSRLFELSDKAIKEYIMAFEESYLLFNLERFSYSLKEQIRTPQKIYAIDPGQVNAIAFKFSEDAGRLLENIIFLELKRLGVNVFYYKTKNDREIDFIIKKGTALALIQVAWTLQDPSTQERERLALVYAMKECNLDQSFIITLDREERIIEQNKIIYIIPAIKFLCLSNEERIKLLFS